MKQIVAAAAITLAIAACSPEQADAPAELTVANATPPPTLAPPELAAAPPASTPATAATPSPRTLTLDGLGTLKIGAAVPTGSRWAERGAQVPGGCTTVSSPDFPGAYAIVEGGKVRRITIGQRSDVKLVEGIGTAATEAAVRAAFPGFREELHKYVAAPGKYLTAPNAPSGDPALRFEIGADRKVSLIHVGTMPVLGYVEGCA